MKLSVKQRWRPWRKAIKNKARIERRPFEYSTLEPRMLLAGDLNPGPSIDGLWMPKTADVVDNTSYQPAIRASSIEYFGLDETLLRARLASVPLEYTAAAQSQSHVIRLPTPNDTYERFVVLEAPIMELGLAEKFPNIKTYRGLSLDDPTATIRFDVSQQGFHAQVISPLSGTYYVDPYFQNDAETYAAYFKKDVISTDYDLSNDMNLAAQNDGGNDGSNNPAPPFGNELRTYQLAVSATGEYTQFHGGTVPNAMAAITTTINRINQVFENDLAVRMVLVSNNDELIFTNGATDPFSNDDAVAILEQNQDVTDSTIGSSNYDIGHVFSTNGGGLAFVGVVGDNFFKAKGTTGSSFPMGPDFDIDLVAHEVGHQFGAGHSWNGDSSSCNADSYEAAEAYEPGSGSTIMGYSGICGNDNLQFSADPMFHSISIDKIRAYITAGVGNSSATITNTGNSIPSVDGGPDYVIPANTPFELIADGSDADSGDELTYSWEQRDRGPRQDVNAGDNGSSPIFRAWMHADEPNRVFPRLIDLLNNTTVIGETLPTTDRTLNFRVVVRDNASGGGGVNEDNVQVNVNPTGAPFRVTSHNSPTSWQSGSFEPINWDVAGTNSNGINTGNVDIFLSTDGGLTFSIMLAEGVPNDGTQFVTVPNADTSNARIKIKAAGNIFFDVNDIDFTILPPEPAVVVTDSYSRTLVSEGGTNDYYAIGLTTVPTGTVFVTATADAQSQVSTDAVNFSPSVIVDLTNDIPRQIFVRAVDDMAAEDNHTSTITHEITASGDPTNYPLSLSIPDLEVTVIDNDVDGVGEAGFIEELQNQWVTVNLNQTYLNPVVVAGPSSTNGADTSVVRVRNVTSNTFQIRIDEWDYQDEGHGIENVGYMVFESGTHVLADGTVVTAGVANNVKSNWMIVDSLNAGGVLVATVVSENDSATIAPRVRNVGDSFEIRIQEEEAADGVHAGETVGWVQFGPGSGMIGELQYVSSFSPLGVSHLGRTINFGVTFSDIPVLIAGMQTTNGGDPATLRQTNTSTSAATVFVEEEKSADVEIIHGNEDVGFVAIEIGILKSDPNGPQQIGESNVVTVNSNWQTVTFSRVYDEPVVVFGSMTTGGNQGSTIRMRNLTSSGFEVRVREWDYLDGNHGFEQLGYSVIEAGSHTLADGTRIEAGRKNSINDFRRIVFDIPFESAPIVMSQVTSDNGFSAVTTRMQNIMTTHFDFRIQEEEANDNIHGAESIGWIAIEENVGSGYETGKTGNVSHNPAALNFAQTFAGTPVFLAQMQTFNGGDPANMRHSSLNATGAIVFVQEEQSNDSEIAHAGEVVGYFALDHGAILSGGGASPLGRPAGIVPDPQFIGNISNYFEPLNAYVFNYRGSVVQGSGVPHRNSLLPRTNNAADVFQINNGDESRAPLPLDPYDSIVAAIFDSESEWEQDFMEILPTIDFDNPSS